MKTKYFTYLIVIAFFISCKKENMGDCFKSTGPIKTETRSISPFTKIITNDNINLFIKQGPNLVLEVSGGENLLEFIKTKVVLNTLNISNQNKCNWVRSFKKEINITITLPELNEIEYYGSGDITFLNQFKTDEFYLNMFNASGKADLNLNGSLIELKIHTGPSDIKATGITDNIVLYNNGNGILDADNLQAKDALAITANTGELKVNATDFIKAEIRSRGDIILNGDPEIELSNTGSGELIRQ